MLVLGGAVIEHEGQHEHMTMCAKCEDVRARAVAIRAVVAAQWAVGVRLLHHYFAFTAHDDTIADWTTKPSTWTREIVLDAVDLVSEDGTWIAPLRADEIARRNPGSDDVATLLSYLKRAQERNSARKVMEVLLYDAPTPEQIVDGEP